MKILVTGGAGFIGSNFVQYLLKNHPLDHLVVVDKLTYAGNLRNLDGFLHDPRLQFVRMDICDSAVHDVAHGCDAAVHFAAESHVDRSIEDAAPFMRTNVEGTWRMIETCRRAGVARFVHVSTDEVYGSLGDHGKFTESSPLEPTSPYAASKAASDLLILSAVKTHGFPAIVTRCTNNYGPFQFPEKFIPLMIAQALSGRELPVYGDGRNVRDWIHVLDHCLALDTVLRKGRVGNVYNIGGECEMENINVARTILRSVNRPESLLKFVTDRPAHDRRYALDCEKIKAELAWQPSYRFDQGLEETICWYRDNTSWLEDARSGEYQSYFERHYSGREQLNAASVGGGR
ncbi:MAG TPA: dTDP-glucose 4,6-dehydratase [Candidatus Angelobacter sp.]|nr:dTDP-glucose 4,6-dehydratase [Candidatus Angelobacter sp.]